MQSVLTLSIVNYFCGIQISDRFIFVLVFLQFFTKVIIFVTRNLGTIDEQNEISIYRSFWQTDIKSKRVKFYSHKLFSVWKPTARAELENLLSFYTVQGKIRVLSGSSGVGLNHEDSCPGAKNTTSTEKSIFPYCICTWLNLVVIQDKTVYIML